ncbi:MAG: lysozyme inhibitor LprI family protein [Edaphobacter sp.]
MQAAEAPASLMGTWDVIQVAVDASDQPHWLYQPNDPRLLGRELEVSSSEISLNDNSRTCMKPVWGASGKIALHALIGKSFKRPPHFGTAPYPSLADFGLKLKDSLVTQRHVRCTPADTDWGQSWFVSPTPDTLLTNYAAGVVLVLQRRSPQSEIKPSFSCAKAQGASERAICTSAALAGYDRSVTAAYHRARNRADDKGDDLKREQEAWIKQRDACGPDVDCLAKKMHQRVDELMQD